MVKPTEYQPTSSDVEVLEIGDKLPMRPNTSKTRDENTALVEEFQMMIDQDDKLREFAHGN